MSSQLNASRSKPALHRLRTRALPVLGLLAGLAAGSADGATVALNPYLPPPPSNLLAPGYSTIVQFGHHAERGLQLRAKMFVPGGDGPFPAVVVMHGSGGLWKNDDPNAGVMKRNFEDWGKYFLSKRIVGLFVDSYEPRGLQEFANRRPAENPALDETPCSPKYRRPKDAYAALDYLRSGQNLATVVPDRVGLMGFSHGAESALAAVVHQSVLDHKTNWTVSYLTLAGTNNNNYVYPAPSYPVANTNGFACVVAYYPGCGFHGYFGKLTQPATIHQFMPYVPTVMFHGTADSFYADGYPTKLVQRSEAQRNWLALPDNPLVAHAYANAGHSFDEYYGNDPAHPNAVAKADAQAVTRAWLEHYLVE